MTSWWMTGFSMELTSPRMQSIRCHTTAVLTTFQRPSCEWLTDERLRWCCSWEGRGRVWMCSCVSSIWRLSSFLSTSAPKSHKTRQSDSWTNALQWYRELAKAQYTTKAQDLSFDKPRNTFHKMYEYVTKDVWLKQLWTKGCMLDRNPPDLLLLQQLPQHNLFQHALDSWHCTFLKINK